MTKTIPTTAAFELATSRRLESARYPHTVDRVFASYASLDELCNLAFNETGPALLPSDEQLEAHGVDLDVLARALEKGMDAKAFTTALNAGLVNIDAFNNSPFTRTRKERAEFNEGILHLAAMANRRSTSPINRVLNTMKPLGMASKRELRDAGVDLTVLKRAMKMGMCGVDFTDALRAGLIDVDAFNNSPYTRTRSSRRAYNQGITTLAEMAIERMGRQPRQAVRTSVMLSHREFPPAFSAN